MRKPRDYDSELKALADKARQLKDKRVRHLGELIIATGADALDADLLAGALLDAVASKDATTREGWRKAGAAFFRSKQRKPAPRSEQQPEGSANISRSERFIFAPKPCTLSSRGIRLRKARYYRQIFC